MNRNEGGTHSGEEWLLTADCLGLNKQGTGHLTLRKENVSIVVFASFCDITLPTMVDFNLSAIFHNQLRTESLTIGFQPGQL